MRKPSANFLLALPQKIDTFSLNFLKNQIRLKLRLI